MIIKIVFACLSIYYFSSLDLKYELKTQTFLYLVET